LIHVKPFRTKATFQDYKLLLQRFVQPHFKKGKMEAHVLFDKPPESGFNPKQWEQSGRDEDQVKENNTHVHTTSVMQLKYHQTGRSSLLVSANKDQQHI